MPKHPRHSRQVHFNKQRAQQVRSDARYIDSQKFHTRGQSDPFDVRTKGMAHPHELGPHISIFALGLRAQSLDSRSSRGIRGLWGSPFLSLTRRMDQKIHQPTIPNRDYIQNNRPTRYSLYNAWI